VIENANNAITISLVAPKPFAENGQDEPTKSDSLTTLASFHPKFTYPIFGEKEQILGYRNLKVNLQYHASDMRPCLSVSYGSKSKVGDKEPTDIMEAFRAFLPGGAF
jgi:histone acetyltransferase 1